jgi:hypothetical protein
MASNDANERPSTRSAIIVGVLIAVIPAALGYIASYVDGIRKDRLAFTNDQIEKLYGPLHALAQANDAAWTLYGPSGPKWDNPTKEQIILWGAWIKNVFQPMNLQIEQTIVAHSQLVVGDKLPGAFQTIIAHTEAYKALMSMWKKDDINELNTYLSHSANTVASVYPSTFDLCVGPIYTALKKRQEALQNDILLTFSLSPVPIPPECNEGSTATGRP